MASINNVERLTEARIKYLKNYLPLMLIISISLLLRFFIIGHQSLWYDEGMSLYYADSQTIQEALLKILGREAGDKYQPLYYLLLFYWRSAFGKTEFALRSFSAILGVGSVIILYFATLKLYGKKHAIWSSLLLACSSFSIYYSQEARPYSLLIFLTVTQVYFFSRLISQKQPKLIHQFLIAIFTALGCFGSLLFSFFSIALCLAHLLVYKNFKQWVRIWLLPLIFSSPILWFYLSSPAVSNPTITTVTRTNLPIIQNIFFVIYGILVGTTYGPPLTQLRGDNKLAVILNYLPQLTLLFSIILIVFVSLLNILLKTYFGQKFQHYHKFNLLFTFTFIISFAIALIFTLKTQLNWLPRHSFYLCIPLVILLPSTLTNGWRKYSKLAVICLIILNLYSISHHYFNQAYWRDDYRGVAYYLIKNREPDAKSIILQGNTILLKHYGDMQTIDGWQYLKQLEQENFAELIQKITNNSPAVFLVINREHTLGANPKEKLQQAMSDLYVLNKQVSYQYITLYRFSQRR
ncbi:glycosyltransferase family 39 protein [Chroococcus sp. FPU101]|uniref:glycosyltransferase family 39 protein n=1 Tax=Chroococcus sp. FPU101 TaxID=1974212 RepID=UPI001A8CF4C4|nr:glycosyltransferase family 39 protein [Chroococcus sp. FPU101]GFE69611.1 hypothetical protein CFPU101_22210 [Chroococcus sp. FPU101]